MQRVPFTPILCYFHGIYSYILLLGQKIGLRTSYIEGATHIVVFYTLKYAINV